MMKAVRAAWRTAHEHRSAGDHENAELYAAVARDRARALARRRERERGWSVRGSCCATAPAEAPRAQPAPRLVELTRLRRPAPLCRN